MNGAEVVGELTGARFCFQPGRELQGLPGSGQRYRGCAAESGGPVYVHVIDTMSDGFEEDLERARRAVARAQRPEIRACSAIVQLLDFHDQRIDDGEGRPFEVLMSIWEWGEPLLEQKLGGSGFDAERLAADVRTGVGAALECLHTAGLVHCDVAPNNVLHVAGQWKLGDLDHCVDEGAPITGLPRTPYAFPGSKLGQPARSEIDDHGLSAIVDRILEAGTTPAG